MPHPRTPVRLRSAFARHSSTKESPVLSWKNRSTPLGILEHRGACITTFWKIIISGIYQNLGDSANYNTKFCCQTQYNEAGYFSTKTPHICKEQTSEDWRV